MFKASKDFWLSISHWNEELCTWGHFKTVPLNSLLSLPSRFGVRVGLWLTTLTDRLWHAWHCMSLSWVTKGHAASTWVSWDNFCGGNQSPHKISNYLETRVLGKCSKQQLVTTTAPNMWGKPSRTLQTSSTCHRMVSIDATWSKRITQLNSAWIPDPEFHKHNKMAVALCH